jgi:uncharacterized protein
MLRVRLTPSGGADRIEAAALDGAGEAFLKARVRAAPEHGEANSALEALIARELGLARTKVRLVRGAKARLKILSIADAGAADIDALIARYAGQA